MADQPDIVLVLTDQQRADACAREGFPLDTTPFLDSLGEEGAWFDRAYTTAPLCCPARTTIFTGRYPSAHRVVENPLADAAVFDTDLAAVAHEAGYKVAMVGKNHTYMSADDVDYWDEFSHNGRVDSRDHAPSEGEGARFDQWLEDRRHRTNKTAAPFAVEVQNPHRIVSEALEWMATQPADQPTLLVVSFPEPHNPYQVPEPYFSMFPEDELPPVPAGAEARADLSYHHEYLHEIGVECNPEYDALIPRARASYYGMMRLIDDEVRRLHEGLAERHGQREHVMVVTSDHGDYTGTYGLVRKGAEIPDILSRIPMVWEGSAIRGAGEVGQPEAAHVSLADLMPTFCEVMGRPIPNGVQGRSLWPLLTGQDYPEAEFASAYIEQGVSVLTWGPECDIDPKPGVCWDNGQPIPRLDELNSVTQSGRRRKVRSGAWTLYADTMGDFRLFNVEDDPCELVNLWGTPELADVQMSMMQLMAIWQMRAEDPLPVDESRGYVHKTDPHGYLAPHMTMPAVRQPGQ